MYDIIVLDGKDLDAVLATIQRYRDQGKAIRTLRIEPRSPKGCAIKINEDMWSPTIGRSQVQA